ncbi:hypothetical protein [Roseivivax sp. CAU 1753]
MTQKPLLAAMLALGMLQAPAVAQDIKPEQAAFSPTYTHAKIATFAEVAHRVADLKRDAMTRYFEAGDATARRALIDAANAELRAMIEAAPGLTLSEFDRINAEARTDRGLNLRIARALRRLDATD